MNWDRFDFAFECPKSIKTKALREGYQAAYTEMRQECEALDLPVGFIVRASALLDSFIKHQQTKNLAYADDNGYANPAQEKDAIRALTELARDYDELVLKARPKEARGVSPEAVRDALVMVLRRIEDQDLRVKLQMQFVSEMEKIGL